MTIDDLITSFTELAKDAPDLWIRWTREGETEHLELVPLGGQANRQFTALADDVAEELSLDGPPLWAFLRLIVKHASASQLENTSRELCGKIEHDDGTVTRVPIESWKVADAARVAVHVLRRLRPRPDLAEAVRGDDAEPTPEAEKEPPALTEAVALVLRTMARSNSALLLSIPAIIEAIDATERLSEDTVGECVNRLIDFGLAERPAGDRSGARLTMKGLRLAANITV